MSDLPEQNLILQLRSPSIDSLSRSGVTQMSKDEMLLKLLDALVRSWLETMTPVEIGSDVEKIQLLRETRAGVSEGEPSDVVRDVYYEVFLSDWSQPRTEPGGAA